MQDVSDRDYRIAAVLKYEKAYHRVVFVLLIHLSHVNQLVFQLFHAPHLTASQTTNKNCWFTYESSALEGRENIES